MTTDTRRSADARRARLKPWRKWYSLAKWKRRRAAQLHRVPWCEPCKALGITRPATVANHLTPHRGDPLLFWHGALESTCKPCHDAAIQKAEAQGFRVDVGSDGYPTDPNHPFNRPRRRT